MAEKVHGFFNDDGTPVNPDLIPKPGLCATCTHDGDPDHETFCALNRMGQQGEGDFQCEAYEKQ